MNKPEPINIPSQPIITRKLLAQIAGKAISDAKGRFTDQDIYETVKATAVSANWRTLLDETCWAIVNSAIDRHATPRISGNADWIGYGDTVIKLSDGARVKVYHAMDSDMETRERNVKDNMAKIKHAGEIELGRIETIRKTMRDNRLTYAGEALEILDRSDK